MLEQDQHDLSDDSDYAASQQQGMGRSTLRTDSSGSGGGDATVEVVYCKENVAIHPTQFSSERISGRLRLSKQGNSLFMSWMPYKPSSSGMDSAWYGDNSSLTEKERSLYTIRDVALDDFHSIRRHTPAFGWQYVIVVLSSGLAFPPLYFYSGGVREFLSTIKQHIFIIRSADDANVFLVNNPRDPLHKTLSSLELQGVVSVANEMPSPLTFNSTMVQDLSRVTSATHGDSSNVPEYRERPRRKSHDPARDLSIQVLEKFSLVTRFARETTSQLFRENHYNSFNGYGKGQQIQKPPVDVPIVASPGKEAVVKVPVAPDPLEYEQSSLIWGKPRMPAMGHEEWSTFLDSKGRIMDSMALRKRIFYGGVQHALRKEVWKFLLGYHAYDSTYAEREYLSSVKKADYETIKSQWQSIPPIQARRFTKFRERKGLIEKDVVRTDRSMSFYEGEDNKNVELLHDILLTYSFYNFDLGYCQGMSDFLSPILFVIEDESESFWCFAMLMERLGANFNRDQSGMHAQLFALSKLVELLDLPLHNYLKQADCLNYFFCFRWILIQFKREFDYDQVLRLWEVLWTHYLSEHLHLYVCVAIMKRHRQKIMGEQMDFDTLLKFINGLSCSVELEGIIRDAEALCNCAGESGAACIPPGTPSSLPDEATLLYQQDDEDDLGKTGCV